MSEELEPLAVSSRPLCDRTTTQPSRCRLPKECRQTPDPGQFQPFLLLMLRILATEVPSRDSRHCPLLSFVAVQRVQDLPRCKVFPSRCPFRSESVQAHHPERAAAPTNIGSTA